MYLIPAPKKLTMKENDTFVLHYNNRIVIGRECDLTVTSHAQLLKKDIWHKLGFCLDITKGERESGCIYLTVDQKLKKEEYRLTISEAGTLLHGGRDSGIELYGGSDAGILYGIQTLRQLIEAYGAVLPCMEIEDYPDIPNRGFFHDVTRGRIPTLVTMKAMADQLAYYKINQLQLYIEHSFLFKDFSEVWRDDTPLTPEEILELDAYCKNLHIDLIPSVASFGHLYKVLRTKTYSGLCELPDADKPPYSIYKRMAHHTLDTSNPESFEFVKKMLSEFMPLFSSDYFNFCADETFDLGKGRSKELADRIGVNNMYVDFVKRISDFVIASGKKPMFWGDIICGFPEALEKLPKDIICLNWGYDPKQDERVTKIFADAGAVQYVCPGVQGWNQFINPLKCAYDNISRMSGYALKYHAAGLLNTDWGDLGHVNHPEFSTAGMIYGAAFSWNGQIPEFEDINRLISRMEYGDSSETFLSVVTELPARSVFTWFEVVCFKEAAEKRFSDKPWAPVLEDISFEKVKKANEKLEEDIARIYRILSGARAEKRGLYKAYLIAAEGMKLWNDVGVMVACGAKENRTSEAGALAVRLEYWFRDYRQLWLSVSKESELDKIGEITFWYADYLRTMAGL